MKKAYQKPSITVVNVQMSQMLCLSDGDGKGVQSLSTNSDGFGWDSDGITGDDY